MARLHNAAIEKHIPLYRRMQSATQNGPGRDLKRFVESTTGGSNLRVMLSRELYAPPDFEKKLDTSNLDIFPCDNGVFVTEAGAGASRRPSFRPIHSTDYLTKTSGWAYDPLQAREKRAEVERFLEQVLPVAEERAVFLTFAASLLSGRRLAKRFLVFTGNNGKSMLSLLVEKFYGQLAVGGNTGQKFVIRTAVENRGRNDHDAGTQGYANCRAIIAEELNSAMLLDESMLKTLVSPMPTMQGRKIGQGDNFKYPWTAGFILIFNEDHMPKVDPADSAFWARVVVVPFRSKFVPAPGEEEEPFTYPIDTHIVEKMDGWLSAFADVLCDVYNNDGAMLDTIPPSMREWKDDVKATNNQVAEWMKEQVNFTGDKTDISHRVVFDASFVKLMHNRYMESTEANVSLAEFTKLAKAFLKDGCCEWHVGDRKCVRVKIQNGNKVCKNVMVGLTLNPSTPHQSSPQTASCHSNSIRSLH